MTSTGNVRPLHQSDLDPVFAQIRREAEEALRREPELGSFLASSILNHATLEQAVGHRLASRLSHPDFPGDLIRQNFLDLAARDPSLGVAIRADILAVADRDPACQRLIEPVLYFKGFHALRDAPAGALAVERGPQGFRALSAKPLVVRLPDRHQSGRPHRQGHFPRPRHRPRGRRDGGDRGRRVDPAQRDAGRHRPRARRPPSEDPPRRADRRRRQNHRQYRDRPLLAHRGGVGGAQDRAAQCHGGGRAGAHRRRLGLRGAGARNGPDSRGESAQEE